MLSDSDSYMYKCLTCFRAHYRLARTKITRTRVAKYWTSLQRLFNDSVTNTWTRIARPTIELCQGYIVRLQESHSFPGCDYGSSTWGRIDEINMEEAELVVELFDPNMLAIRLAVLPFNSTFIEWYKASMLTHRYQELNTKQVPTKSRNSSNDDMRRDSALTSLVGHAVRNDVIEAKEVEKPGIESVTDGFYVSVSINGNIEKCGQVMSIDPHTRILRVVFYDDEIERIEDVPYDHPFLVWYKETMSTAARIHPFRPRLNRSIGFEVALTDEKGDIIDRGKVCDYNVDENTVTVRFQAMNRFTGGNVAGPDRKDIIAETFVFDDDRLVWYHSMRFESNLVRPPLRLARGFTVHVKATDTKVIESEYYVGIVHGVDEDRNMIAVKYEEEPPKPLAAGKGGKAQLVPKVAPRSKEPVVEWVDYDSPDVAWMVSPRVAIQRSTVARPRLDDAIGYAVEVMSTLPDSVEGDFFQGIITSVNAVKMQVVIRFLSLSDEDGQEMIDEEAYPYDSVDIAWVGTPIPWIDSAVERPELSKSVGYGVAVRKFGSARSTQRRAVRCGDRQRCGAVDGGTVGDGDHCGDGEYDNRLDDRVDYVEGVVQFADVKANTITVLLRADASSSTGPAPLPVTQIFSYESRDIAWMSLPPKKAQSTCPMPEFEKALGYVVDVRVDDWSKWHRPGGAAKEDNNYIRGMVASLKGHKDMQMLGIRLLAVDSETEPSNSSSGVSDKILNSTTLKYYSYGSEAVVWIREPRSPLEQSLVPRPRSALDALGYVVEVPADAATRYFSLIVIADCLILMDACIYCISSSPCLVILAVACYSLAPSPPPPRPLPMVHRTVPRCAALCILGSPSNTENICEAKLSRSIRRRTISCGFSLNIIKFPERKETRTRQMLLSFLSYRTKFGGYPPSTRASTPK
jgi:hypothetical protein